MWRVHAPLRRLRYTGVRDIVRCYHQTAPALVISDSTKPGRLRKPLPPNSVSEWGHGLAGKQNIKDNVSTERLRNFYDTSMERYTDLEAADLSFNDMITFGENETEETMLKSARFVHRELPIRLAHRLRDMKTLPYLVLTNPHIMEVYHQYVAAFDVLRKFPPIKTMEDNHEWCKLLSRVVNQTGNVVDLLAKGVSEATRKVPAEKLNVDDFLRRMLLSRIGRRVLAEQHVELTRKSFGKDFVGTIRVRGSVLPEVEAVAREVKGTCMSHFGTSPEVEITVPGELSGTVPFIPQYLDYALMEIFKNAMRATIDRHKLRMPKVQVLVSEGDSDLTIVVSDKGGGIPKDHLDKVFTFGFTTFGASGASHKAKTDPMMSESPMSIHPAMSLDNAGAPSALAGYGFGLPLARLYSEFHGGALEVHTIDDYGTDVYLKLDKHGTVAFSDPEMMHTFHALTDHDIMN
eukprot:GFYU01023839.1.p1 GENE.GFYU01023839.1~~GFYU01023839.1.p1  ORF type:complete len:461 (-),score=108.57 GFYU01023839.1:111-1493(-)